MQAIATQTRRHTETAAEFGAAFGARLRVLARSNDVLTRADWHDTNLQKIIESALAAHGGKSGRITVESPSVLLGASLAVAVSLSFHELATNAVKYGALSVPVGRVEVAWTAGRTRREDCEVAIVWRERGGPMVEPPTRRGFGSHVLEKRIPSGGTVKLDYQPEGLEYRMCLSLSGSANQTMSS